MFVTASDFIDLPYNLPKMTDADTIAALQNFINRNEAIELRQILGGDLYEAFAAAMNALPALWQDGPTVYNTGAQVLYGYDVYQALQDGLVGVVPGSDPTKWGLQLRNRWQNLWAGESYTDQNQAKQNWVGMKELLKPMIFAYWLRDNLETTVQDTGVINQVTENAEEVSARYRFADALEAYSLKVGKFDGAERDTLYNYLFAKAALYNDIGAAITTVNGVFTNYLTYYFCNPGFVNDFGI